MSAHRNIALALAGAAFVLFWGLPTLVIPFAADQSWFALGARTILDGDKLYEDFHDQKAPLVNLLYTVPFIIGGERYESVRIFDLLNTLVAMGGVFMLARRFLPDRAGVLAAAVYGFIYLTTAGSDGLAETESFIVAPLTLGLALYPVHNRRGALPLALASGLLLGFAFGLKFSVAPFVFGLPILELLLRDRQTWRLVDAVKRLAVAGAAFVLVQVLWVLYLVLTGVLDDFLDIQRNYTIPYQNLRWAPNDWVYPRFVIIASENWMSRAWYITGPAVFGLMLLLLRGPRPAGYFLGLLAAFAIVSVWWQGKFFLYHWLITLPFLAMLAGYALHSALERVGELTRPQLVAATAAGLFALGIMTTQPLISTYDGYHYLEDRLSGALPQETIDARYTGVLAYNHEIVAYVVENSGPDDPFMIWGTWPQALLWAERPSSSDFITAVPLRADWTPEKWRIEYLEDLEARPPLFFAVSDGDWQPWLTGTDRTSRQDFCDEFPELRDWIEENYEPVFRNPLFVLYERDAASATVEGACS